MKKNFLLDRSASMKDHVRDMTKAVLFPLRKISQMDSM